MKLPLVAKGCLVIGLGLNILLLSTSSLNKWVKLMRPESLSFYVATNSSDTRNAIAMQESIQLDEISQRNPSRFLIEGETESGPRHYSAWNASEMKALNHSISIIVDLTGEFGNHLHHIAHGRVIQTVLWQDHGIASHLVLRRHSNDEKYLRTQRQLKKCFPNLRSLDFHGAQSSAIPSQKTLETIQSKLLGNDQAQALILNGGSTLTGSKEVLQTLVDLLQAQRGQKMAINVTDANELLPKMRGISFPFVRTGSMVNRDMMDKFYDDFRDFFQFDEEACCTTADLPDPEVAVFHFRNFMGELKKGKSTGLEELSAQKVATDIFANSTSKGIAIATRFPGRKASQEYFEKLQTHGFQPHWLTTKDSTSKSPPAAMDDFCAMRRTTELVGMVRSTFAVWAALLGNANGVARLYSVDSRWTREKYGKNGKPIFRTYNWTHPELQRRIHFELYKSEDLEAQAMTQ